MPTCYTSQKYSRSRVDASYGRMSWSFSFDAIMPVDVIVSECVQDVYFESAVKKIW